MCSFLLSEGVPRHSESECNFGWQRFALQPHSSAISASLTNSASIFVLVSVYSFFKTSHSTLKVSSGVCYFMDLGKSFVAFAMPDLNRQSLKNSRRSCVRECGLTWFGNLGYWGVGDKLRRLHQTPWQLHTATKSNARSMSGHWKPASMS